MSSASGWCQIANDYLGYILGNQISAKTYRSQLDTVHREMFYKKGFTQNNLLKKSLQTRCICPQKQKCKMATKVQKNKAY